MADRFDRISQLYHEVVARQPHERRAFLDQACGGDRTLRDEVETLLRYEDAAAQFIESPSLLEAAARREDSTGDGGMAGGDFGPYAGLAALGSGGMGDVYRARDTRLGRDVAIKFLRLDAVADPASRARFEREARLLATLNHPNIAQIYGLEQIDGLQALVMELVPGETLADAIRAARARQTALPVAQALALARQIADAVDAAHEKGILHRDLKPANIKITPDGVVKVLDFGLAKNIAADAMAPDQIASNTATGDGVILGTAGYMSPEQARGLPVDRRTDVWSFGCVLFEMLTGRPAFDGPTSTDTLAAVVQREPDWALIPPSVSPRLRDLLQRCLAKDPRRRVRDIGDVRWELDAVETSPGKAAASNGSTRRERVWMVVAAAAMLCALGAAASHYLAPVPAVRTVSFTVHPPPNHAFAPLPRSMALSPDGRHLAFVSMAAGRSQLWVRALDSVTARALDGTEGASRVGWSPDSGSIAFVDGLSSGRLKRVELAGGAPVPLVDWTTTAGAWSPTGQIVLAGRDGRLYRVPDRGGEAVTLFPLDQERRELNHRAERFLPDGRRFIFEAFSQDASKHALYLGSLDGTSRTHLLDGLSSVDYADGYLLYQRAGTLVAQLFDTTAGRLVGSATPMIENLFTAERGAAAFSVSDNGTLAYRSAGNAASATLAWFDRQGRRGAAVGGAGLYESPRLSPDGRFLAVSRKSAGQQDIWIIDLERNVSTRLTSHPGAENFPVWSPDGSRVIFTSNRSGPDDLYWRAADGSGEDTLLFASPEIKRPTDVSRDGTLLFTVRTGPGQQTLDVWGLRLADPKPFRVLASAGLNEWNAVFSPDGRRIAYARSEPGGPYIYLQSYPPTGPGIQVSTTTGMIARWSGDGREIFYGTVDSLTVVDVSDDRRPGAPRALFPWPYQELWTVDRSGQRFLRPVASTAEGADAITVILNWTSQLKQP